MFLKNVMSFFILCSQVTLVENHYLVNNSKKIEVEGKNVEP